MVRPEAGPGRTDMVVDTVGEAVADSEVHEEVTVVVVADLWALPLRLETGDAVRGQVPTVVEVAAASEAEEVVTSELLHCIGVLLSMWLTCTKSNCKERFETDKRPRCHVYDRTHSLESHALTEKAKEGS